MEEVADKNALTLEKQKELYVATLAHDLKNPLNAQISALEQFYNEKFGGITTLQKEILGDIISSSKFMREMLSSLLSVYKFENGAVKLNKTNVDIDVLIKACLKDVIPFADEHCLVIEYINTSKNNYTYCDECYIRRVVSNMLSNLVLYSYKNTKAYILLDEKNDFCILRFKSLGYPIEDELKSHIFEKYASTGKKSGTGLGLYFCKKVIEAHGGEILLNSQNSDIEFVISIPKNKSGKDILNLS